jgi:hypothetical protein
MKKIILIVSLVALATTGGYAQKKVCTCKKKTVYHHAHHYRERVSHKTARVNKERQPLYHTNSIDQKITINMPVRNRCVIDSNGDIDYVNNNTYLGYYEDNSMNCDFNAALNPPFKDLVVTSSVFKNYGVLPAKYTCEGEQASPPLKITNIPAGTVSLALIMFDPNATPEKSTTYWLMWNIDTTGVIPENFITDHTSQNIENKQYGYQAVCPVGGTHYYHFRVYALNTKLLLNKHTNKAIMESALRGHVLAKGELIGLYNKHLD